MSQHTPGPWFLFKTYTGALSINETRDIPIATIGGAGWHLGQETAEANARLITAAPDLLEVAIMLEKQIVKLYRGMVGGHTDDGGSRFADQDDVVLAARAIIAKATSNIQTSPDHDEIQMARHYEKNDGDV